MDCPDWWAVRFGGLMLSSYLQVVHTNRSARSVVERSEDNVLPCYIEAMAPLLVKSPKLLDSVLGWLSKILCHQDLFWPVARVLHIGTRGHPGLSEQHKQEPEGGLLGRLPPEMITHRI